MSQKKVNFFRKANVQINKTNSNIIDDTDLIEYGREILNVQINDGDAITDNEMVGEIVGTKLDWYAGDEKNDMIVNLHKGDWTVNQPLDEENVDLRRIDSFVPISSSRKDVVGGFSSYRGIFSTIEYDGYIVINASGTICSYHIANKTWHTPESNNGGIVYDRNYHGGPACSVEYNGWIVFNTSYYIFSYHKDHGWTSFDGEHPDGDQGPHGRLSGHSIYSFKVYDGILFAGLVNGKVVTSNGGKFVDQAGTVNPDNLPYNNGSVTNNKTIYSMEVYDGELFFGSQQGYIGSYDSSSGLWTNFDGTGGGSGFHDNNYLLGSYRINSMKVFDGKLIIAGYNGRIATHDSSGDDTTYEGLPNPINYFNNDSIINIGDIYHLKEYNNELLIAVRAGISSFNLNKELTKYDGSGGTGFHKHLYNEDYYHVKRSYAAFITKYDSGSKLFLGSLSGCAISYDGVNWVNYRGEGGGTGPYHSGLVGKTRDQVQTKVFYDNKLIYASKKGSISFFNYITSSWVSYDSGHPLCIQPLGDSRGLTINIYSMVEWNGFLIVSGFDGRVSSWDGTNWKFYDGTGTGTGPYHYQLFGNGHYNIITTSVAYGNFIVFGRGTIGAIASFDGTAWKYSDGTGTGTGPYKEGISVISAMIEWNGFLITSAGRHVSSYDGTAWKNPDGSGTGTGPYADLSSFQNANTQKNLEKFKNGFVLFGTYSINSFDGTNWKYQDGTGTGDITFPFYEAIDYTEAFDLGFQLNDVFYIMNRSSNYIDYYKYDNGVWDINNIFNNYVNGSAAYHYPISYIKGNNDDLIFNEYYNFIYTVKEKDDILNVWENNNRKKSNAIFPGTFLERDSLGVGTGENLFSVCEYGDYVVMAIDNEISSYHKINKTFHTTRSNNGGIFASEFETKGTPHTNLTVYNSHIIAFGFYGRISSFDGTNWKWWDGSGTGTGTYDNNTVFKDSTYMYASTIYNGILVCLNYNQKVASFDGTAWKNADGSGTGTGPYNDGSALKLNNGNCYNKKNIAVNDNKIVISSSRGSIASWDGTAWKFYDGSGTGTGPYNDGSAFGMGNVLFSLSSGDLLVIDHARISSYDGSAWKYYDGNGSGTGMFLSNGSLADNVPNAIEYDNRLFIVSRHGKTSTYSFADDTWSFFDGTKEGTGATGPYIKDPFCGGYNYNIYGLFPLQDQLLYVSSSSGMMNYSATHGFTTFDQESGFGIFEERLFDKDAQNSWTEEKIIFGKIYDNKLVVVSSTGRVSFFDFSSNQWSFYSSNIFPARNKRVIGDFGNTVQSTTKIEEINDLLVFIGSETVSTGLRINISNYSKTSGQYSKFDGTEGTQQPFISTHDLGDYVRDTCVYTDNGVDYLMILSGTYLSSWDGTAWKFYDGSGTGTGPYNFFLGDPYSKIFQYKNYLIVIKDNYNNSGVSSWDGTAWKYADGSGTGTGPYLSFVGGSPSDVLSNGATYGDFLVVSTNYGKISSWDGTAWKFYDGSGTGTGPYIDVDDFIFGPLYINGVASFEEWNGILLVINYRGMYSYDGSKWNFLYYGEEMLGGTGPVFEFGQNTGPFSSLLDGDILYTFGYSETVQTYDLKNNAKNQKDYDNSLKRFINGKAIIYE